MWRGVLALGLALPVLGVLSSGDRWPDEGGAAQSLRWFPLGSSVGTPGQCIPINASSTNTAACTLNYSRNFYDSSRNPGTFTSLRVYVDSVSGWGAGDDATFCLQEFASGDAVGSVVGTCLTIDDSDVTAAGASGIMTFDVSGNSWTPAAGTEMLALELDAVSGTITQMRWQYEVD